MTSEEDVTREIVDTGVDTSFIIDNNDFLGAWEKKKKRAKFSHQLKKHKDTCLRNRRKRQNRRKR